MRWLPYEKWEVQTPLDVPTLVKGLSRYAEPYRLFSEITTWWKKNGPPFYGKVDVNGFRLQRRTWYRNHLGAVLSGRFVESPRGTTIQIKMASHPFVAVFTAIQIGILGVVLAILLVAAINEGQGMIAAVLGGMFVFGVVMAYGRYWWDAPRSKRLLSEALAEIEREAAGRAK
jgi:hypothetical protein